MAIDPGSHPVDAPEGPLLTRAATALREYTDEGWSRARDGAISRARWTSRPSVPVTGMLRPDGPSDRQVPFVVHSVVLVALLRARLDRHPGVRPDRIVCHTGHDHAISSVAVAISAAFGTPLLGLAASIRRECAAVVRDTLGLPELPDSVVSVDVLVDDVFRE